MASPLDTEIGVSVVRQWPIPDRSPHQKMRLPNALKTVAESCHRLLGIFGLVAGDRIPIPTAGIAVDSAFRQLG